MDSVTAVLLAAGASRRLEGNHKALLDWQGQPLLRYQLAQLLRLPLEEVVVVLGYAADQLLPLVDTKDPRVSTRVNPNYRRGKTSSIKLGVADIGGKPDALMILGVDQPRPVGLLRKLLECHLEAGALLSLPTYQGRRGHPPVYARALLPELLAITEAGQGLREIFERHQQEIHEVPVDSELALVNINTRRGYQAARRLASTAVEGGEQ